MPSMRAPMQIVATSALRGSRRVTAAELDTAYGRPEGTTLARSGVSERWWASDDETSSTLAARAVSTVLAAAGWEVADLDALIVTAAVPEQPIPTTAVLTLGHLGYAGGPIEAYDVNATCLSFLNGLDLAATKVAAGQWHRVVVVAVDLASKGLNHDDIESSALFGDGAAAVALAPPSMPGSRAERSSEGAGEGGEPGPEAGGSAGPGVLATRFETYPTGARLCEIPAGGTRFNVFNPPDQALDYAFRMDGMGVIRLAARHLPRFIDELLAEAGLTRAELDVVVPHQTSGLGMKYLKAKLGFDPAQVIDILDDHGNQVAASLPSALDAAVQAGRLPAGSTALLIGTGAGLVIGGMVVRL